MIDTKDTTESAPAALFREKLKLADGLNCRELLGDLERSDRELADLIHQHADMAAAVGTARQACQDAETLAGLSVEGRNEAERKANRALSLQRDPAYQAACAAQRRAENALADHDATLEVAKRTARRIERTIDYRLAVMRFLGG